MSCYVYILYSQSLDLYYIGCSENPEERLRKHLGKHKGFTGRAKDWIIVHKEQFESTFEALRREKQLKGWKNRERIEQLIRNATGGWSIPT